MISPKTVLAVAFVAIVTSPWNANGLDGILADQSDQKKLGILYEGFGRRDCDLYDMGEIQPGLVERIYAMGKARRPGDLFRTALSDSAIVRQSNGNSWLIRVFYPPEELSPWQNTVWVAKLTELEPPHSQWHSTFGIPEGPQEIPRSQRLSIFTLSEVVPVRIPETLAGFMEPFRSTRAVALARKSQLESMLRSLDEMIRNSEGAEEIIRNQAESIRKYGNCCGASSRFAAITGD